MLACKDFGGAGLWQPTLTMNIGPSSVSAFIIISFSFVSTSLLHSSLKIRLHFKVISLNYSDPFSRMRGSCHFNCEHLSFDLGERCWKLRESGRKRGGTKTSLTEWKSVMGMGLFTRDAKRRHKWVKCRVEIEQEKCGKKSLCFFFVTMWTNLK